MWWRSSLSQIQERTWDTADRCVVGPFKRMKRLTSGEATAGLSQGDASHDEDLLCRDRNSGDDRMMVNSTVMRDHIDSSAALVH